MPNNGSIALTMDGINTKTISIPEGYTSGGTVSLDGTIDEEVEEQTDLIEQIKNAANNLPEAGSSDSAETVTIVNNTGRGLVCGAAYIGTGDSVQVPHIKSGAATYISIILTADVGSITATSTSGSLLVFYKYTGLTSGSASTQAFCSIITGSGITSGSTITIST